MLNHCVVQIGFCTVCCDHLHDIPCLDTIVDDAMDEVYIIYGIDAGEDGVHQGTASEYDKQQCAKTDHEATKKAVPYPAQPIRHVVIVVLLKGFGTGDVAVLKKEAVIYELYDIYYGVNRPYPVGRHFKLYECVNGCGTYC